MAARSGIPGIAVALAVTGAFLAYVGINNVSVIDGVRSLLKGTLPAGSPPKKTEIPSQLGFLDEGARGGGGAGGVTPDARGGNLGAAIVATATRYLGVPYVWGGKSPKGWDCSGYVYYVLNQVGVKVSRISSGMYLTWSGAVTVKGPPAPGDLCVWATHIGIAVNGTEMAHAPTFGQKTKIGPITGGAVFRRVKAPPGGTGGGGSTEEGIQV